MIIQLLLEKTARTPHFWSGIFYMEGKIKKHWPVKYGIYASHPIHEIRPHTNFWLYKPVDLYFAPTGLDNPKMVCYMCESDDDKEVHLQCVLKRNRVKKPGIIQTSHELARKLLEMADMPLAIAVSHNTPYSAVFDIGRCGSLDMAIWSAQHTHLAIGFMIDAQRKDIEILESEEKKTTIRLKDGTSIKVGLEDLEQALKDNWDNRATYPDYI